MREEKIGTEQKTLQDTRLSGSTGDESDGEFYRPRTFSSRYPEGIMSAEESIDSLKHGDPLPNEPESELERARR